ncbi:MAG: hypothetical protein MUC79_02900 [Thiobacillaceae bacterium]|jgi:hypothetical protein|nr:hypothetical protein [Thiobacillaceae bacterium]
MFEQLRDRVKSSEKFLFAAGMATWCGFVAAGELKGDMLFPWEAHGKLHATGPNTLMLLGEIEGTLYVESGQGKFDGAAMVCPMIHEINVEEKSVRGEGRCTIFPKASEDVVFASYTCVGQIGTCEGTLELTAGTGKYQAIRGVSSISSRTAVADLAIRLGSGGSISNAEGLMKLSEFVCNP